MKSATKNERPRDQRERLPHRVRLPGFVTDEEIGLGDLVTRASSYLAIRPCGGCKARAAALNRWMVFGRRGQR